MKSKTNTTKKRGWHFLSKLVRNALTVLLFTMANIGYAQNDSCSAKAYFSLATTDYKNITITNYSSGSNLKYLWDFMDGTTSIDPNPGTHFYNSPATHYVYLQLTDTIKHCSSYFLDTIQKCTANFSAKTNPADRYTYVLNNYSTGSDLTYLWNFGDGQQSNLQNPVHTYTRSGTFTICLTIQSLSDSTCSDMHCDSVNILNTVPCNGYFTLQKDSMDNHKYYVTNLSSGITSNCKWDFGDGYKTFGVNPGAHSYIKAGWYTIMLEAGCQDSTVIKSSYFGHPVEVSFDESCKAFFTIAPDSSTADPYDFIIYNQSSGTNLTYHWEFGDGDSSDLVNPIHTYAGTGPYVISLTVGNDSCFNEYRDTLQLSDTLHHLLPAKFHITVIDKTVTGLKKNDLTKATLLNYPNPFSGTTTISYGISVSSIVELEVYNLLGVKVATIEGGTKAPGNYMLEWYSQSLQEGIYLLQLKTNNQLITKKIIINK